MTIKSNKEYLENIEIDTLEITIEPQSIICVIAPKPENVNKRLSSGDEIILYNTAIMSLNEPLIITDVIIPEKSEQKKIIRKTHTEYEQEYSNSMIAYELAHTYKRDMLVSDYKAYNNVNYVYNSITKSYYTNKLIHELPLPPVINLYIVLPNQDFLNQYSDLLESESYYPSCVFAPKQVDKYGQGIKVHFINFIDFALKVSVFKDAVSSESKYNCFIFPFIRNLDTCHGKPWKYIVRSLLKESITFANVSKGPFKYPALIGGTKDSRSKLTNAHRYLLWIDSIFMLGKFRASDSYDKAPHYKTETNIEHWIKRHRNADTDNKDGKFVSIAEANIPVYQYNDKMSLILYNPHLTPRFKKDDENPMVEAN
jgi:hypothetical protein